MDRHWLYFKKQPNKTGQSDCWLECLSRKWILKGCWLPRLFDVCDPQPWPFLVFLSFPCKRITNKLGHFQNIIMIKLVTMWWWINISGYIFIPIIIKKNRSSRPLQWLKVILSYPWWLLPVDIDILSRHKHRQKKEKKNKSKLCYACNIFKSEKKNCNRTLTLETEHERSLKYWT